MADTPIGSALLAASRAQRNHLTRELAPHGIHPGQDQLLLSVWYAPGMRQSDLARELGVEPPTVTRMVMRLERSGLVERRSDPADGRAALIYPTQRSRLLEPHVRRIWQEMEVLLAGLPSSDRIAAALDNMRHMLESAPAGTDSQG